MQTSNVNVRALKAVLDTLFGEQGTQLVERLYQGLDQYERTVAAEAAMSAMPAVAKAFEDGHKAGWKVGYDQGYDDAREASGISRRHEGFTYEAIALTDRSAEAEKTVSEINGDMPYQGDVAQPYEGDSGDEDVR